MRPPIGNYKSVIWKFVFTIFWIITTVNGQRCSIDGISDGTLDFGVYLDDEIMLSYQGEFVTFTMQNTLGIKSISNNANDNLYLTATLGADSTLTLSTTENFVNYAEEQTAVTIVITVGFDCTQNDRFISFHQRLTVTNDHDPVFSKSTYNLHIPLPLPKGFDLTTFGEIYARDIDLVDNRITFSADFGEYSDILEIGNGAIGADSKTFYATIITKTQLLTITNSIAFEITATDSGSPIARSSTAVVYLESDADNTYLPRPVFESALYKGSISESGILTIENIILDSDTFSEEISFTLEGGDSALFDYSQIMNFITISLKGSLSETDLEGKSYLSFMVIATRIGVENGATSVIIDIPLAECEIFTTTACPEVTTEEPATCPVVTECPIITTETPEECPEVTCPDVTCSDCTTIEPVTCPVVTCPPEIECTTPTPEECPEATCPTATPCPDCIYTTEEPITCPPVTECPTETPGTTSAPTGETPSFDEKWYIIEISTGMTGIIGTIQAKLSEDNTAVLAYSLLLPNDTLESKITINPGTGELSLLSELPPNIYTFEVIATSSEANAEPGTAIVSVVVQENEQCSAISVEKSLMIKELTEGEVNLNILSTQLDNCNYIILGMEPNDKEYFTIDTNTNMLTSININREDSVFSSMSVPQIQLKLKLQCPETVKVRARRSLLTNITMSSYVKTSSLSASLLRDDEDSKFNILTNEISFATDVTVVNVIILDVNDNAPVFEIPASSPYLIGYPAAAVAAKILPPHLLIVHASDLDTGINAQIRYTIDTNDNFAINPENGMIYPLKNAMSSSSSVSLQVNAIDKNGATDGLTTSITINVKKLDAKHLTMVTVQGANLNDVDNILEYIKSTKDINLLQLHAATVSLNDADARTKLHIAIRNSPIGKLYSMINRRLTKAGEATALRMIVYGFDSNNDPIDTTIIQEKLNDLDNTYDISSLSLEDATGSSTTIIDNNEPEDFTGWIVAITILSVLLILLGVVSFLGWWFWIRPYEYKNLEAESTSASSDASLSKDFEKRADKSSPIEHRYSSAPYDITGITVQESSDDQNKLARSLTTVIDKESDKNSSDEDGSPATRERQKSFVTFNEAVERIEIETEEPVEESYKF